MKRDTTKSGMPEPLICCQAHHVIRTVGARAVRKDSTAEPSGLESLTHFQETNRTRVGVRTVKKDIKPSIESLTFCQANRTRLAVRTVRRNTGGPGVVTHILSSQ